MKIFILVLIAATIIGGFSGGEVMDDTFSILGAVIGGVGTAAVLLGIGAYFDAQAGKRKNTVELTPEIRGVFDRLITGKSKPTPQEIRREKEKYQNLFELYERDKQYRKENETENKALEILHTLLMLQLAPDIRGRLPSIMGNKRAQGYLFGFHDALLRNFGLLDISNPTNGLRIIKKHYTSMFGENAGQALFSKALRLQTDDEFSSGRNVGGEDFTAYLDLKRPPLALNRILILGLKE